MQKLEFENQLKKHRINNLYRFCILAEQNMFVFVCLHLLSSLEETQELLDC